MKTTLIFRTCACIMLCCCLSTLVSFSQDSPALYDNAFQLPDKFFGAVRSKSEKMQHQLLRSSERYLTSLAKKEKKLQRKLARKDSAAAKELFGNVDQRYDSLKSALNNPASKFSNVYSGRLDSMSIALKFMQSNGLAGQSSQTQAKLQGALKQYGDVQGKFNQTQFVQQQLKERQQVLQDKLKNFGMIKEFCGFQEKVYYYRAQVDSYKNIFEEPKKLEATVLKALTKIPSFQKFFSKHSQLASLFRLPGADEPSVAAIPGLQTRAMVTENLEQRLGSGPNVNTYMSGSIRDAQGGLNSAKQKLLQLGSSGSDMNMPNFKPNNEKSKSFLKRLELGTNVQSTKSNSFFPVTTDFGMSVGYKFSAKAIAGLGASYKMGWGRDIKHISISHEGVGLRSFTDIKLKGSIWITGGAEMNYRSRINDFSQLNNRSDWQQSALAGISKKYKISSKVKGNMQVLYDFLHRRQTPITQPIVFRVGYQF